MPEPTLPDRLVTAAVDAMPWDPDDGCLPLYTESGDVDRWVPVECVARDVTAAVLRELHDAGYQTITMDGFGLETDINRVADEIEAIAANLTITDIESTGVAHHRHTEPEWCPHPNCHDRAHLDGVHTDEHGHPFRNQPEETP